MPLSKPKPRNHLHSRDIACRGFRRDDGLWDIEARLTDMKTYSFDNHDRGGIRAGEPVHDMWIRLTLDDGMTIHAAEAATDAAPFNPCAEIPARFPDIVGLVIGPGWRKSVIGLFGRLKGCTHLTDLLIGPVATTAMQTIHAARADRHGRESSTTTTLPKIINSCHAFRDNGPVVERLWPERFRADGEKPGDIGEA